MKVKVRKRNLKIGEVYRASATPIQLMDIYALSKETRLVFQC
jgi:hypothetical protein